MFGAIDIRTARPSAAARFEAFYREHAHDTYCFVRMICRNEEDAKDIAADVMAVVATKWKNFEPDNPRAYLRRMVTNAVIDRDRRAKRYEQRIHKIASSDRVDHAVDDITTRDELSGGTRNASTERQGSSRAEVLLRRVDQRHRINPRTS